MVTLKLAAMPASVPPSCTVYGNSSQLVRVDSSAVRVAVEGGTGVGVGCGMSSFCPMLRLLQAGGRLLSCRIELTDTLKRMAKATPGLLEAMTYSTGGRGVGVSVGSGVEVGGSVSLGAEVLVGVALAAPGAKARPERAINAMITAPISMNTAGGATATGQGRLRGGPR